MAVIQGSPISTTYQGDRTADRAHVVETKPAFKKRSGTRKRAGAVMAAALASMSQSFWGIPDQTRPRAASEARRPNHKLRQQLNSLLDQLLAGRDRKLPPVIQGLHLLLGEIATIKYGSTPEQNARPFIDAYFRGGSRNELLMTHERLDILAGAESLFATLNETNRQDVKGVMAVLKRSVLGELAARGIGEPLRMLARRLCEDKPDIRHITKAWFALEEGVRAGYEQRLHPVQYLQAGLDRLPTGSVRVFAMVLAPRVPQQARAARAMLDFVVRETPRDIAFAESLECLDPGTVHDAVRLHIACCLELRAAESARKLENATRPGVRTAEIANRVWRDIRDTLDATGWVYLDGIAGDADDDAAEEAAVRQEAERQFVRALEDMPRKTAAACLARLDTERLIAMYAHRGQWTEAQHVTLGPPLDRARDARLGSLQATVEISRRGVEASLTQARRLAAANALVNLSDALAARERFAYLTAAPQGPVDDSAVNGTIARAAASLRLSAEPGEWLGPASLRMLDDAAFTDLRRCDQTLVSRGLALDPAAAAMEARRRSRRFDAAVQARLVQLSDLLRGPGFAPRPFIGIVAAAASADVERRAMADAFAGGATHDSQAASPPALGQAIASVVYRGDGAMPVQWMESRRHIGGLLRALLRIRATAGASSLGGGPADTRTSPLATLDTSISILRTLGRHFGIDAIGDSGGAPAGAASDPYWNDGRLPETAAFFGIRFEPARRRVAPLLGAMHRARLLAALSKRMAQPVAARLEPRHISIAGEVRTIQVDKHFHDAAYRNGGFSLAVEGATGLFSVANGAGAGRELARQPASSLDSALGALSGMAGGTAPALTRLLAAIGQGIDDFVIAARGMPPVARWLRIPEPDAVRHVHFHVGHFPRGGYRVDVSACMETSRPETEARLTFSLRMNETAHRVTSLIVAPEMRLLPTEPPLPRNDFASRVTTAGRVGEIPSMFASNSPALLVAAGV
jgi:hypothetical protein